MAHKTAAEHYICRTVTKRCKQIFNTFRGVLAVRVEVNHEIDVRLYPRKGHARLQRGTLPEIDRMAE